MMKKSLFLALLAMWLSDAFGQAISPQVLTNAGDSYQNNNIQLDWTLGETVIMDIQNDNQRITQGFHQPYYAITSLEELPKAIGTIQVYPNPTIDEVNVELHLEDQSSMQLQLLTMEGKVLWTKQYYGKELTESVSLRSLPSSTYLVQLKIENQQVFKTFKIQKAH